MKITFLGTHGQYNLGDELLLETFLTQLGDTHQYAVNSYDPEFTASMLSNFNVEPFHTTKSLFKFLTHILSCDILFFGGGSIIKELYASVGRFRYSTLLMILATVTFTKQFARKKIIMSNIGVGPLQSPWGERLARWILNQTDYISVRDTESLKTCKNLQLTNPSIQLVPDAVFANPPEHFISNLATPFPSDRLHLALNLNYDILNREAWEPFQQNLAEVLIQLNKIYPITIHALPMQSKFKENDDLSVLKSFLKKIPDIPNVIHNPQTAQQAAEIINCVDLVIAERLHTLVISTILGKPFFALIYDVKVRELVNYLGMTSHSLDINQPFTSATLNEGVQTLIEKKDQINKHLISRSKELYIELMDYFSNIRTWMQENTRI